jgi:hypothetical protein
VKLSIAKNAEVLSAGKFVARPSGEDPAKNSVKINIPAGWFAFVSGVGRFCEISLHIPMYILMVRFL